MFRHIQIRRELTSVYQLGLLAGIVAVAVGCGSSAPVTGESVNSTGEALLSTACTYDATGNITLKVQDGEVAYLGFQAGCVAGATEGVSTPACVVVNAVDASANGCKVASTGKTITITGGGAGKVEKVILDYTNGLFGKAGAAATTAPVSIALDTATGKVSQVVVMAPTGGGNMAAGASGIDIDTTSARTGGAKLDVKLAWSTTTVPGSLTFQGGAGADIFTADVAGWTAAPAGWDTAANLTKAVGTVFIGALTANGGAGDDILAGGAGTNALLGGLGNDTFLQGTVARAEVMSGGEGFDTVDYGIRTAALTITLDGAALDGASGEKDNVATDIEIVKGGAGNDSISAAGVTTDVVLIGGAGDDVLIGGAGDDDLCGGLGNDRMKWSAVSAATKGDYYAGGGGIDTIDYGAAGVAIVACLNPLAVACATSGSERNGPAGQVDVNNDASIAHVCPRANMRIDVLGTPTATAVPGGLQGGAMSADVENVTGDATHTNTLVCQTAVACTAVGGAANDVIIGSSAADALFGGGASTGDTVTTSGGNDLVDLTHAGAALTDTLTCGNTDAVTILITSGDTVTKTTCGASVTIQ